MSNGSDNKEIVPPLVNIKPRILWLHYRDSANVYVMHSCLFRGESYGYNAITRRVLYSLILWPQRKKFKESCLITENMWGSTTRPGTPLEGALKKATALRDALADVSARLRAAAEYAHGAVRMLDDALPAWKLTAIGK